MDVPLRGYGRAARFSGGKFGVTTNYGYVNPLSARLRNPVNRQLFNNNVAGGAMIRAGKRTQRRRFRRGYDRRNVGGYRRLAGFYRGPAPEVKNYDTAGTLNTGTSANWQMVGTQIGGTLMIGLAQGPGTNQRIGRKISLKSVQWKGIVAFPGGTFAADTFFWAVVLDMQNNGATPSAADVFSDIAAGYDLRNIDNIKRFKVLKRGSIAFTSPSVVAGPAYTGVETPLDVYIPMKNLSVDISATSGAVAEFKNNQIYFMSCSYNGQCNFEGSARVRYTDC